MTSQFWVNCHLDSNVCHTATKTCIDCDQIEENERAIIIPIIRYRPLNTNLTKEISHSKYIFIQRIHFKQIFRKSCTFYINRYSKNILRKAVFLKMNSNLWLAGFTIRLYWHPFQNEYIESKNVKNVFQRYNQLKAMVKVRVVYHFDHSSSSPSSSSSH